MFQRCVSILRIIGTDENGTFIGILTGHELSTRTFKLVIVGDFDTSIEHGSLADEESCQVLFKMRLFMNLKTLASEREVNPNNRTKSSRIEYVYRDAITQQAISTSRNLFRPKPYTLHCTVSFLLYNYLSTVIPFIFDALVVLLIIMKVRLRRVTFMINNNHIFHTYNLILKYSLILFLSLRVSGFI